MKSPKYPHYLYEYSEKELKLINFFGFDDMTNSSSCPPPVLYKIMAEKAFVDNMSGKEVDSLRRCLKATRDCNPFRMTPEFDALIEI